MPNVTYLIPFCLFLKKVEWTKWTFSGKLFSLITFSDTIENEQRERGERMNALKTDQNVLDKVLAAIQNRELSPTAKVLYTVLCNGAKAADGVLLNVYTQDEIMELTGIRSKTTIKKGLNELEKRKMIGIMKKHVYNVYVIY